MLQKKEAVRYLQRIVTLCIVNVMGFSITSYVAAWFDVNTVPILAIVVGVFGLELILTAVIKLVGKEEPKKETDKKKEGNG